MAVLKISSRTFKNRQTKVFDAYFTPEIMAKIDKAMKEAEEGKVTEVTSIQELKAHLKSL
ncbi:MAG: hypothetical protein LBE91_04460 [Tannerella sp.]|jgi:hypothetical protein|nr:hypothetical protein [Tannerella sp.]